MSVDPQHLLRELFATAIDAAHPRQVLEPYLPADRSGRVIVIGAGILYEHLGHAPLAG